MLFEETILEKGEYQKFLMFRVLKSFEGSNYTIIDIANEMNTSYQQTYNILQELLEDIQNFPNTDLKDLNRKKFLNTKKIPISIDMYRLFLLKQSLVFQFINYVVQGSSPNVEKFCQDHYISRSTLLRKNAALKVLLEKYKIKISYNDLSFIGDEKSIRFFIYCFYWLSYRGLEWPFETIRYYDVAQQLQLEQSELNDPIVTIRTVLFWTITRIRIIHGYHVTDMDKFDQIFPDNLNLFNSKTPFTSSNFPKVPADQLIIEAKFFNFFRLQSLVFPIMDNEISQKIYDSIKESKGPVWQLTNDFIEDLQTHLINNEDSKMIAASLPLQANLMRIFFSYYIMQGDYLQFNDFYDDEQTLNYDNSVLYEIVSNFVEEKEHVSEFTPYLKAQKKIIKEMEYLLIPYLRYFKSNETVKVKLVLESSDLVTRDMMTFLNDLSFVEIATEGDNPANADVIITSIEDLGALYENDNLDDKIVIDWNLDATETEYFNLYQSLKKEFTKKIAK
ncbi:helix-turn-helix domain-containing protein [Xylocopilactobacillus apis]|uniref:Transcriptional regulator n=1 Tax=Xylocopilactobacillus apis TaxID=2932183 RepID=A0AAU9DNI4_9LACO|nr:helix-turn-helix domain-containing protein [Xylocopilactobacillus apis]BDR57289.1 transcriptional regulator [Xylocopilactobacillus apis]